MLEVTGVCVCVNKRHDDVSFTFYTQFTVNSFYNRIWMRVVRIFWPFVREGSAPPSQGLDAMRYFCFVL